MSQLYQFYQFYQLKWTRERLYILVDSRCFCTFVRQIDNAMDKKERIKEFLSWCEEHDIFYHHPFHGDRFWLILLHRIMGIRRPMLMNTRSFPAYVYLPSSKMLFTSNLYIEESEEIGERELEMYLQPLGEAIHDLQPRWVVTRDHASIRVYDMSQPEEPLHVILLENLERDIHLLETLIEENASARSEWDMAGMVRKSRNMAHSDSIQYIVNETGYNYSEADNSAIYTVLDQMATNAIKSRDLQRIKYLLEEMKGADDEGDIAADIIARLGVHYKRLGGEQPTDNTREIVEGLKPIFKNNTYEAEQFLKRVQAMKPTAITAEVNRLMKAGKVVPKMCKSDLWSILHDNGLYPPSKSNWNSQVN